MAAAPAVYVADATAGPRGARGPAILPQQSIDTEVLERLLRQRLAEVEARAVRMALADTRQFGGAPLQDMLDATLTLVTGSGDLSTRSQALLLSFVRAGLAYAIAVVVHEVLPEVPSVAACGETGDLADTAYEVLAASPYLVALGFPRSDGQTLDHCADFASDLSRVVNSMMALANHGRETATVGNYSALESALTQVARDCNSDHVIPRIRQVARDLAGTTVQPTVVAQALQRITTVPRDSTAESTIALSEDDDENAEVHACAEAARMVRSDEFAGLREAATAILSNSAGLSVDDVRAAFEPSPLGTAISTNANPRLLMVLAVIRDLVSGRTRRATIDSVVALVRPLLDRIGETRGGRIVRSVVEAIPYSLREESGGSLYLDTPTLAARASQEFNDSSEDGLYIRATIGAGIIIQSEQMDRPVLAPALFEELGFGWRFNRDSVRHDVHLFASGLLFRASVDGATQNLLAMGIGYGASFFQLVDLSLDVAVGIYPESTLPNMGITPMALLSIQLPLTDYIAALADATTTHGVEAPSGGIVVNGQSQ